MALPQFNVSLFHNIIKWERNVNLVSSISFLVWDYRNSICVNLRNWAVLLAGFCCPRLCIHSICVNLRNWAVAFCHSFFSFQLCTLVYFLFSIMSQTKQLKLLFNLDWADFRRSAEGIDPDKLGNVTPLEVCKIDSEIARRYRSSEKLFQAPKSNLKSSEHRSVYS